VNDWKVIDKKLKSLIQKNNLKKSKNVEELQDLLNKYVYGREQLQIDGFAGEYTYKGIKEYKFIRKYWPKTSKVRINPSITYKLYQTRKMYG
jgi:peptidoglycan hydrolase-like protein with peptidoglycan-binding domain